MIQRMPPRAVLPVVKSSLAALATQSMSGIWMKRVAVIHVDTFSRECLSIPLEAGGIGLNGYRYKKRAPVGTLFSIYINLR